MPYRLRLRSRSQAEANTAPELAVNSMPVNVDTVEVIGLSFLRWRRGSGNVRPPWKRNANQTGGRQGGLPLPVRRMAPSMLQFGRPQL